MKTNLRFPDGITLDIFLRDYWQKKPLLFRQCLDTSPDTLTPEELAGLACEDGIEGRIILEKGGEKPWEVRFSPFQAEDFTQLPNSHWTLLVQDVDKHIPAIAELLKPFQFIPNWRVDDVMVSFAQDQGSVGPHTDNYDVFLFQQQGKRRWNIHSQPIQANDFVPNATLKRLKHFETEQSWLLEAGDMLYLPPKIAHWGSAEGDCLTCSIGFVSSNYQDMLSEWCEDHIQQLFHDQIFTDQPLSSATHPGEILPNTLNDFADKLHVLSQHMSNNQLPWFGRYATETKDGLSYSPLNSPITVDDMLHIIQTHPSLSKNSYARVAFCLGEQPHFFANGQSYPAHLALEPLLQYLSETTVYDTRLLSQWLSHPLAVTLLTQLVNDQHILLSHD